jgi:hypothetical protein
MERSNFSLRLLPSLLKAAQRIAERENCSVNQLVNVALAEKVAVLDQERWDERKRKAIAHPPSKPGRNCPAKSHRGKATRCRKASAHLDRPEAKRCALVVVRT